MKSKLPSSTCTEYLDGLSSVQLARKYNTCHQAVLSKLKRNGVPRREARCRALYDDKKRSKQIIFQYKNGIPMDEIAEREHVSEHTIKRVLEKNNITKHPKHTRSQTITMPSDRGVLGYIAGMFDGEGNLQFKHQHEGRSIGCRVIIYSTTLGVADWFQNTMQGGTILWDRARVKKHGWKPISSWCLYRARDVASFLWAILPFLIIKKADAEKAIALFSEHFEINSRNPRRPNQCLL